MFFGSYPIVVEGDTELAAFVGAILEDQDALSTKTSLIPARGKSLITPIIKLLTHFGIPFGVLHDSDSPHRRDGKANSAWIENKKIAEAIANARAQNVQVRHRISVPDFERAIGTEEGTKDKPLLAYQKIREDPAIKAYVQQLFTDLVLSEQIHPRSDLDDNATGIDVFDNTKLTVSSWATENAPDDSRFKTA